MRGLRCASLGLLSALVLVAVLYSSPLGAQVSLQQYQPAPLPEDGFALGSAQLLRPREWSLVLSGDYANDPLVYRLDRTPGRRQVVVGHHVTAQLGAAVGAHRRVMVFANLPVHLMMRGDTDLLIPHTSPDGPGLGDLTLGARVRLVGADVSPLALTTELLLRLPFAELAQRSQRYSGDEIGSYEGALVGELRRGVFGARMRLGARFRKTVEMQNLELGQALLFGVAARVRLPRGVTLHAELFGSTYLTHAFARQHTPLELLLGPKYRWGELWIGAAAGPGLVDGYGSPDLRALITFGRSTKEPEDPPQPEAPGTRMVDSDSDGVSDQDDRCPALAVDRDGDPDHDGCPARDQDADGVVGLQDRCPSEPEDDDGFDDADGCPEHDDDGDGVLDGEDRCPRELGIAAQQGCPPMVTMPEQTVHFGRVEFAMGRDTSLPGSVPTLHAVHSILTTNPRILRVRVEGHADDNGGQVFNQELAKRRARAVARWLVAHGIAPARLELVACGQLYPFVGEPVKRASQRNRRVEFHVIDPHPVSGLAHSDCEGLEPP